MTPIMRIAAGIMLVLFISWAGFQYNDPDAVLWAIIYGAAAIFTLIYLFGRFPPTLAYVYAALCAAYAAYLIVRIVVESEFIFAEQGREMIGLLICGSWMTFLAQRQQSAAISATGS